MLGFLGGQQNKAPVTPGAVPNSQDQAQQAQVDQNDSTAGAALQSGPEDQQQNSHPGDTTAFEVVNSNGFVKRTFTVAEHGEDAEKLAHEFAAPGGFTVRPATTN